VAGTDEPDPVTLAAEAHPVAARQRSEGEIR
jgi:hypothetical protein